MKGRSLPIGQPQSSILARVFFPPSSGLTPGSTGSRRAGALVGLVPSFPHCLSHLARLLLASAGCWLRQGGESEGKGKGYFYLVRAIIVPSSYRMPSLQSLIPVLAPPPPSCGNLLWVFQTVCVLPPWVVHWGSTLLLIHGAAPQLWPPAALYMWHRLDLWQVFHILVSPNSGAQVSPTIASLQSLLCPANSHL